MLADGVRVVRLFQSKPILMVILVQLQVFAVLAMLRTVDGDEGDYMFAARRAFEGRLPMSISCTPRRHFCRMYTACG